MSRAAPGSGSQGDGTGAGADDLPLACIELVELVTEYLDETLDPAVRARVDRHLALCPYCATYVEQIREVVEASSHLDPEDVPPDVMGRLLTAFREVRAR